MFGQMGPHPAGNLLGAHDGEGLRFETRVRVRNEGGSVVPDGDAIEIRQADGVTLICTAATSYMNYRDISGDPSSRTRTATC